MAEMQSEQCEAIYCYGSVYWMNMLKMSKQSTQISSCIPDHPNPKPTNPRPHLQYLRRRGRSRLEDLECTEASRKFDLREAVQRHIHAYAGLSRKMLR